MKKFWQKIKDFFAKRKAKADKKKAAKLAQTETYEQLYIRNADIAKKLNTPLDPETRESLLKEQATIASAMKQMQDATASRNDGKKWILRTLVGTIISGGFMFLSVKAPEYNNKLGNGAKQLFEKISRPNK